MSQIIDASTRALQQTATSVNKSISQLATTLEAQLEVIQANQNTIGDQENLISANTKRIETEVRSAAAEVRLQVKEDRTAVLNELLSEAGLIATTQDDLNALNTRAVVAERDAAAEAAKAVKAAESALHSKYGSEIANLKADQRVELSELNAQAKSDATTISLLKGQIESLEATIKANREAEVQKAEHASKASGVVVNAGK